MNASISADSCNSHKQTCEFLFCGGGTGGHILPGISLATVLGTERCAWIGDPERLEARLVPNANIRLLPFGLRRPRIKQLLWLLHAVKTFWNCARVLRRERPRWVIALGGYSSLPPGLLARLCGSKLCILEQNALAGKTNTLIASQATYVCTQFPLHQTRIFKKKIRLLGNPLRSIAFYTRGQKPKKNILIIGGSLAAKSLNDVMLQAVRYIKDIPHIHLIHLAGQEDAEKVRTCYNEYGMSNEVHEFVDDMPALFERVDIAIARAGGTSLSEICAAGIPSVLIPLPWAADNHQFYNAQAVAKGGGAVVLEQHDLSPEKLASYVISLIAKPQRIAQMSKRIHQHAVPQAAERIAALLQKRASA